MNKTSQTSLRLVHEFVLPASPSLARTLGAFVGGPAGEGLGWTPLHRRKDAPLLRQRFRRGNWGEPTNWWSSVQDRLANSLPTLRKVLPSGPKGGAVPLPPAVRDNRVQHETRPMVLEVVLTPADGQVRLTFEYHLYFCDDEPARSKQDRRFWTAWTQEEVVRVYEHLAGPSASAG